MVNLAVPNPSTQAPGNLITGSVWNAQVRDALNFLLNPPIFAANQSTATSAWTGWSTQALQTVIVDSYSGWSNGSPTRYTAQAAGWYEVTGVTCFAASSSGWRSCGVQVNGTRVIGSAQDSQPSPDIPCVGSVPVLVFLNANDYVELVAYTSVSVATNVSLADLRTRMDVRWKHQ